MSMRFTPAGGVWQQAQQLLGISGARIYAVRPQGWRDDYLLPGQVTTAEQAAKMCRMGGWLYTAEGCARGRIDTMHYAQVSAGQRPPGALANLYPSRWLIPHDPDIITRDLLVKRLAAEGDVLWVEWYAVPSDMATMVVAYYEVPANQRLGVTGQTALTPRMPKRVKL